MLDDHDDRMLAPGALPGYEHALGWDEFVDATTPGARNAYGLAYAAIGLRNALAGGTRRASSHDDVIQLATGSDHWSDFIEPALCDVGNGERNVVALRGTGGAVVEVVGRGKSWRVVREGRHHDAEGLDSIEEIAHAVLRPDAPAQWYTRTKSQPSRDETASARARSGVPRPRSPQPWEPEVRRPSAPSPAEPLQPPPAASTKAIPDKPSEPPARPPQPAAKAARRSNPLDTGGPTQPPSTTSNVPLPDELSKARSRASESAAERELRRVVRALSLEVANLTSTNTRLRHQRDELQNQASVAATRSTAAIDSLKRELDAQRAMLEAEMSTALKDRDALLAMTRRQQHLLTDLSAELERSRADSAAAAAALADAEETRGQAQAAAARGQLDAVRARTELHQVRRELNAAAEQAKRQHAHLRLARSLLRQHLSERKLRKLGLAFLFTDGVDE